MQKSVSKKQQTSYATFWPEAFKEAELKFIFVINYVILHFKDWTKFFVQDLPHCKTSMQCQV